MSHETVLPFEQFEKYNLALMIIAKQQELIKAIRKKESTKQIELGINLMIGKLISESDNDVEVMILYNHTVK